MNVEKIIGDLCASDMTFYRLSAKYYCKRYDGGIEKLNHADPKLVFATRAEANTRAYVWFEDIVTSSKKFNALKTVAEQEEFAREWLKTCQDNSTEYQIVRQITSRNSMVYTIGDISVTDHPIREATLQEFCDLRKK